MKRREFMTLIGGAAAASPVGLKGALYQMMFEELEQRGLKRTPEYRNVMLRADQHAEWLAGLAKLCSPDVALPMSCNETERAGTLTALQEAA